MTSNSINYKNSKTKEKEARETKRSNLAKEKETKRSNLAKENLQAHEVATKYVNAASKVGRLFVNDPNWYNLNPVLTDSAGRIPNANFSVPREDAIQGVSRSISNTIRWLGIDTVFTVGKTVSFDHGSDAINMAAVALDTYIRSRNSRSSGYDAADIMLMQIAVDSAYVMASYFKQILKAINYVDKRSFNYRTDISNALWFDFDDILNNYAECKYLLNRFIKDIRLFPLINKLAIFKRHQALVTNVFADSEDYITATKVTFVPNGYYRWSETNGSFCAYASIDSKITRDKMRSIINDIRQSLMQSESVQIILHDLYNAYNKDSDFFIIDEFVETESFNIVNDPEILSQVMNATLVGKPVAASLFIRQDENSLIRVGDDSGDTTALCQPTKLGSYTNVPESTAYDMYSLGSIPYSTLVSAKQTSNIVFRSKIPVVNPDYAIAISQFSVVTSVKDYSGSYRWLLESFSTEIIVSLRFTKLGTSIVGKVSNDLLITDGNLDTLMPGVLETFNSINAVFGFQYTPIIYLPIMALQTTEWNTTRNVNVTCICQTQDYTYILNDTVLDRMHAVAIMSLFGVTGSALSMAN